MNTYSVYIHIPFCLHRCAYCDFNTYAGLSSLIPDYVNAIQNEIQSLMENDGERFRVHTIYFGGGTPSLLPVSLISKILDTLNICFKLAPDTEITLEANPGTLSLSYLQDIFGLGINRISLGMQTGNQHELSFLERQHSFNDVQESVKWIRQVGINNLSLDLIFGLPEQSLVAWIETLTHAINLDPEHFSLYALTVERGTRLNNWVIRGMVPMPDPDLAADMYELASEKLSNSGYLQYEISNWAKSYDNNGVGDKARQVQNISRKKMSRSDTTTPYWACFHNLQYWRNQPYFGFGAGAHGFVDGFRISNVLSPQAYIDSLSTVELLPGFPQTPASISLQAIDRKTEMSETLMMGLRLTREGVSRADFYFRFNQDMEEVFGQEIDRLVGWKLLEWLGPEKDILRLTSKGRLLGNRVFREFI